MAMNAPPPGWGQTDGVYNPVGPDPAVRPGCALREEKAAKEKTMLEVLEKKEKCSCCGVNLDRFVQPVVLSILADEPCTGYAVLTRMTRYVTFSASKPDPTGVYRVLKLMKQRGLLVHIREGVEHSDAAPVYQLTPSGRECLENWVNTLKDYAVQIETLSSQIRVAGPGTGTGSAKGNPSCAKA